MVLENIISKEDFDIIKKNYYLVHTQKFDELGKSIEQILGGRCSFRR